MTERLLTIQEVADACNFSPDTVGKWIASGALRTLNFTPEGGKPSRRVRPEDLAAFLEAMVEQ